MAKMPRRKAAFTQSDIARTLRAAKAEGWAEIEVRIGDETSIVVRMSSSTGRETSLEPAGDIVL
jgi:hypothetical protein